MKVFNTFQSKAMPPSHGQQPQMAPPQQQQQQQQYAPWQQQTMEQPNIPPQAQGQQYFQGYPQQPPPGQPRSYNPKEYYKEFYSNEYQDRLYQFIKRLTRIPNFLMTRKERRLLERMKHKLCHEKDEDVEDLRGIEDEENLFEEGDDKNEPPRGYKLVPFYNAD